MLYNILFWWPFTTPGQKKERVCFCNPRIHTVLKSLNACWDETTDRKVWEKHSKNSSELILLAKEIDHISKQDQTKSIGGKEMTVICWTRQVVRPGTKPAPSICTTRQSLERTSHNALNGSTNSSDELTVKPQSSPVNPPRHTHSPARTSEYRTCWCCQENRQHKPFRIFLTNVHAQLMSPVYYNDVFLRFGSWDFAAQNAVS